MSCPASRRLALGTAQFGSDYGVANRTGKVGAGRARGILAYARAHDLDTLDTAIAYGTSQALLGQLGVGDWRVITKLPPLPAGLGDVSGWVLDQVQQSLNELQRPTIDGLLLHRSADLLGSYAPELVATLLALKRQGIVRATGVSIYDPGELGSLAGRGCLDIVQAPLNLVDQRLLTSGWLTRLHRAGVEVHVRSVFLQGLLLMSERPQYFDRWGDVWRALSRWLERTGLTPPAACLGFVLHRPEVKRVVVGVDSLPQLVEIIASCAPVDDKPPADLSSDDPELINPFQWRLA